jgi:predicted GH43/DUF377 family glycosyl hydrolase
MTHIQTTEPTHYLDGRPSCRWRLEAQDQGLVFQYGHGPKNCDELGARKAWVFEHEGLYYMTYDGAGPKGWLACLATSRDLVAWERLGTILDFGEPGSRDSATATYGTTFQHGGKWHMFYLGSPNASPAPDYVPMFPYLTLKAEADSPEGPWRKRYDITPWRPGTGTYYEATASPGRIIEHGGEFLQFFSASVNRDSGGGIIVCKRTLGIARTKDLDGHWTLDPEPLAPLDDQIENSDLYYEEANGTWFLFTNHIGILPEEAAVPEVAEASTEYTDAVWVYWTKDPNHWDPKNKAVVLDGQNCTWSKKCIGLPGVVKVGDRLAVLYDAPGEDSVSHMRRSIGLAWLDLPLVPPSES